MVFYLPVYLQLALHSSPAPSGLLLLPLIAGIVCGAAVTGRVIVRTGRPTDVPKVGLVLSAVALALLAFVPGDKRLLVGLGFATGSGLGTVMSVMQIVTQPDAGPARLGAAAGTISLARTLGSALGASAFGALIFGLIGGSRDVAALQEPAMQGRVHMAFRFAFLGAAALCLLAPLDREPGAVAALPRGTRARGSGRGMKRLARQAGAGAHRRGDGTCP
jgi:hypothetical protein